MTINFETLLEHARANDPSLDADCLGCGAPLELRGGACVWCRRPAPRAWRHLEEAPRISSDGLIEITALDDVERRFVEAYSSGWANPREALERPAAPVRRVEPESFPVGLWLAFVAAILAVSLIGAKLSGLLLPLIFPTA